MDRSAMSPTQLTEYLRNTGRKGAAVLSILGKNQGFNNAMNSPYGKILLDDLLEMYERSLLHLASPECTDDDRADFRAFSRMATRWISKIDSYQKNINNLPHNEDAE
jgi:hypothetical protein